MVGIGGAGFAMTLWTDHPFELGARRTMVPRSFLEASSDVDVRRGLVSNLDHCREAGFY